MPSWRCHKASVFTWFGAPRAGPGQKKLHLKIASTQMAKYAPNIAPKMAQHGARRRGGALAGGRINFCEAFIKIVSQI